MYELKAKWNLAKTYTMGNPEALIVEEMPEKAFFRYVEGEEMKVRSDNICHVPKPDSVNHLTRLDKELVTRVAMSKYVTSMQLYEYMCLQGMEINRRMINQRLSHLVKNRVLEECYLMKSEEQDPENCIHCFRLHYWGRVIALEKEVPFHDGILYISHRRKRELKKEDDDAMTVKRALAANMILLGLLKSGVSMERFGFMETFRPETEERWGAENAPILRTPLNVMMDKEKTSILAYEIVRDCSAGYKKLEDKIKRYYVLEKNAAYAKANVHEYAEVPQLILCGESFEHNLKIKAFLEEKGLWKPEIAILFTEDLLNVQDSSQSIYEITTDGSRLWYALPTVKKILAA